MSLILEQLLMVILQMERRKLDDEEEALANADRERQITRANRMMYNNRDEVKAFHSKMLLSEVM